jgi:hypothetical protein
MNKSIHKNNPYFFAGKEACCGPLFNGPQQAFSLQHSRTVSTTASPLQRKERMTNL